MNLYPFRASKTDPAVKKEALKNRDKLKALYDITKVAAADAKKRRGMEKDWQHQPKTQQ